MNKAELRNLLRQNRVSEFIDNLFNYYDLPARDLVEIDNLYGQFNSIKAKFLQGLVTNEELQVYENRIRFAFLNKVGELKAESSKKNTFTENLAFYCYGNEPGWKLEINNERILYVNHYGQQASIYPHEKIFIGEKIWYFRSNILYQSKKSSLRVVITEEKWEDDMSGEEFSLRVELIENFKVNIGTGKVIPKNQETSLNNG